MEKRTRPYEVLVRIQSDGTAAAHVRKIEEIVDEGVVISATELPPEPLPLAGPEFDALIPALDQAILATGTQLLLQVDALLAEKEATESELARLRSELARDTSPSEATPS